jgi:hypothetical protein
VCKVIRCKIDCKYHKKKVSPLKREPTNRELKPQELKKNQRRRTTKELKLDTCRLATVDDEPPASQPTTENTSKHNAYVSTGWGAKMQGQTKKYYLEERKVEIF